MKYIGTTLAGLALAAFSHFGAFAEGSSEKVLRVGMYSDFAGFNIAETGDTPPGTANVAMSMFEGLFANDYKTGKIVPRLGVSFEWAPDNMSAIVKLRPNVKFHNGEIFNASAVVSHYTRMMDPKISFGNSRLFASVDHVEAIDDLTVRFVLKKQLPTLQSALAIDHITNMIVAPKAIEDDPKGFNRHPVGTGPFEFKTWVSGDRLVVVHNKNYWDSGSPKLDEVIYRIIPDGNTRFSSIKSGELDIMWTDNVDQVKEAKEAGDLKVNQYEGSTGYGFMFNTSKPPFDDARVRAAAVYAFDGEAFVNNFLRGLGNVVKHGFFPNSAWTCQDVDWRGYNLEKAKQILADIGKPVHVRVTAQTTPSGRRIGAIVQQFLSKAGFDVEIVPIEPSQYGRVLGSGDYQMLQWRYTDLGAGPGIELGLTNFTFAKYGNPKINALLEKAATMPKAEDSKKVYCEVIGIFNEESVYLYPVNVIDFLISRDTVKYIPPNQNNFIRVRDVEMAN